MLRIFQVDELFNAKAGEYSVCSGSSKEASRTERDKLEGHLLVIQHRSNQETRSYRVLLQLQLSWKDTTQISCFTDDGYLVDLAAVPQNSPAHLCQDHTFPQVDPSQSLSIAGVPLQAHSCPVWVSLKGVFRLETCEPATILSTDGLHQLSSPPLPLPQLSGRGHYSSFVHFFPSVK